MKIAPGASPAQGPGSGTVERQFGEVVERTLRRVRPARVLSRLGRHLPGAAGGFCKQLGRYAGGSGGFSPAQLADDLGALDAGVQGGGIGAARGAEGDMAATLAQSNERFAAWVTAHSYDAFATALQKAALYHLFRGLERSRYAERRIDFRLVIDCYAAFRRVSVARVLWDVDLVQDKARSLRSWRELTADESIVNPESLTRYYNSIPFPGTCGLLRLWNAPWLVSRVYGLFLGRRTAPAPSFFDYGGSTGILTSIARSMGYGKVALIDDYDAGLEFARWRDGLVGRTGVDYLRPAAVEAYAERQRFDVGCCHQVLEHLSDLRPCLEHLSLLVRKGGILFLSTGFGLYPHPGHLRSNVQYVGREAALLAPYGFTPLSLDLTPFRLEGFLHVFQKTR
jgi:2-polyprenyl-3-methyl-5-hydroxy-6-metoxy-1,4-benzoquinol methylase